MRIVLYLSVVVALTLSACGPPEASPQPEIQYGRDVCVQCGMIANEAKFAAAYRHNGEDFVFDDLGDLVVYARTNSVDLDTAQTWVHDFETEEWIDGRVAHFVATTSVATPMGHGIVAFRDATRAQDFADSLGGQVVDWETLMALPMDDGRVGMNGDTRMEMRMDE